MKYLKSYDDDFKYFTDGLNISLLLFPCLSIDRNAYVFPASIIGR